MSGLSQLPSTDLAQQETDGYRLRAITSTRGRVIV